MKVLFVAGLVLVATGLPALAQWGLSPGYGSPGYDRDDEDAPRGYGRRYDDRPRGYGRRYDDRPRGYGREYREDDGDRPRRYGRGGEDVGPTGLRCVINPQYRHVLRSCAAAATFQPGQYCGCKLPNSPQMLPGTVQE
jgi:hypothetical protein